MVDEQSVADAAATANADDGNGADAKIQTSVAEGDSAACDALVAATMENPGAPFAPDVVRDLAQLKRGNRVQFESLRTRLKRAGCRVTELDPLIAEENDGGRDGRPPSQADILVALAEAADLFHTPDDIAYADIEVGSHRETWPIQSRGFRRWLKRRFFEECEGAPNGEAVASAIGVIEAKAQHETPIQEVFVRVGELDGKIYLDLCDAEWRAVEIGETGWRVIDRPDIRFRRSPDMRPLPLPEPEGEGSVDGLRTLLNIPLTNEGGERNEAGDADFILAVAFILACLRSRGPYPVMAIGGEQGSAKSTRSAMLRSVVDPRHPRLRSLPRDERDLVVAARNQHVLAFDNISGLRHWLSDALCRIASGAGFGTRELYTDAEEVVFSSSRPIILNGIEETIERPDLAERSLFSTCEPISPDKRKSEEEVWASFDAAHASILGALLDAVATGLKNFPMMKRPPDLPRMADFAHWVIACESALWESGAFLNGYNANIIGAIESVLEASSVAVAVRELMANLAKASKAKWSGTASDLLALLTDLVTERISKSDDWPRNGRALSGRLRRAASFLRRVGINIVFNRDERARLIIITSKPYTTPGAEKVCNFASGPSGPSSSVGLDDANDGTDAKKQTSTGSDAHREQNGFAGESDDFEGEF